MLKLLRYSFIFFLLIYSNSVLSESDVYLTYDVGLAKSTATNDNFKLCGDTGAKACITNFQDISNKIGIGYKISDFFSIEVSKINLGKIADYHFPNNEESKNLFSYQETDGIELMSTLRINNVFIQKININLKLGIFSWQSTAKSKFISGENITSTQIIDTGKSVVKGIEMEYLLTKNISLLLSSTVYSELGLTDSIVDNNLTPTTLKIDTSVTSVGVRIYF